MRLHDQRSTDGLPTISRHSLLSVGVDQLDKADASLIPESYIYLLGVQSIVSLSDGLAGYAFPLYNALAFQTHPRVQPSPARSGHVCATLNADGPALLATISILSDVLGAPQTLALAAGYRPPRNAHHRSSRYYHASSSPWTNYTTLRLRYAPPSHLMGWRHTTATGT